MKEKIVFLCTGNSCRSQMAEGFFRHMASDSFEIYSAGTSPGVLNPNSIAVMHEIGIDITSQYSKHVDALPKTKFAYVITLCDHAKETCPCLEAINHLHWSIDDPYLVKGDHLLVLDAYRRARNEIRQKIQEFLDGNHHNRENT